MADRMFAEATASDHLADVCASNAEPQTIDRRSGDKGVNALANFIREHKQEILDEWLSRVARLPSAHALTLPTLRDDIPAILDRVADAVDGCTDARRPLAEMSDEHAVLRFRTGYDLQQVVAEYRILRRVITDLFRRDHDGHDVTAESALNGTPLTRLHEAIDDAIGEAVDQYAVERDRVRDRFIAVLGHDLRDPLNTILFTAHGQVNRANELDAGSVKSAERTEIAAKRMERMIRDLLDFARGRLGGGFTVVPTRFDARTLICHAVQELADTHPARDVRCLAEHAPGNFTVEWDNDRIAQVVANLVGNALVHGTDPVAVSVTDAGDTIAIEVSNGGEISTNILPHLFDPFVSEPPDARRMGLGLGLYIVQQIAQSHGGTVRAESSNGTTTLIVRLPRRVHRTLQ